MENGGGTISAILQIPFNLRFLISLSGFYSDDSFLSGDGHPKLDWHSPHQLKNVKCQSISF
jgi:hypothetical protein